ncbi:hypothetical protein AgCh_013989 [Apium graveolens]
MEEFDEEVDEGREENEDNINFQGDSFNMDSSKSEVEIEIKMKKKRVPSPNPPYRTRERSRYIMLRGLFKNTEDKRVVLDDIDGPPSRQTNQHENVKDKKNVAEKAGQKKVGKKGVVDKKVNDDVCSEGMFDSDEERMALSFCDEAEIQFPEFNENTDMKDPKFVLEVAEAGVGERRFKRLYVCLGPVKEGFLDGCKLLIGLERCHLRGPLGRILLIVVGNDPNDGMHPLAWAQVEAENNDNWDWFLGLLKDDLRMDNTGSYTFIFDWKKGLVKELEKQVPHAEQRGFDTAHAAARFEFIYKPISCKVQNSLGRFLHLDDLNSAVVLTESPQDLLHPVAGVRDQSDPSVRRNKLARPPIGMEQENDGQQLNKNKPESVSKDDILKQKISEDSCMGSRYHQKLETVKSEEKLPDENDHMLTLSSDYMVVASQILAQKPVEHQEPLDKLMNVDEVLTAMAEQESWKQFESEAFAKSK